MFILEWETDPQELVAGFDAYEQDVKAALRKLAKYFQPQIEGWMKEQARWTDRTGNARQGLHTEIDDLIDGIAIDLLHGVEYGKWLELANQGRFSILMPALDHWSPIIWAAVEDLFR
jgi:hypothetical protein